MGVKYIKNYLLFLGVMMFIMTMFGIEAASAIVDNSFSDDIDSLNQDINDKRNDIEKLNSRIDGYKEKIKQKQSEKVSLAGEMDLLDNRIAKTELEIEETNEEVNLLNIEMNLLEKEIHIIDSKLSQDKELIVSILQEVQVMDNNFPIQVFFGTDSFSKLFDRLDYLETINTDLKKSVDSAKLSRENAVYKRGNLGSKQDQLKDLELSLKKERTELESNIGAKEVLLDATQRSESQFKALLDDLKQEQSFISNEIISIQTEIEGRLSKHDDVGDSSVLSWPIDPSIRGISATFHDPTYPYRHLFEHSGLDLPAKTGTPISSVAPGYVAWARKGRLYGNYVMIIHANGLASLYAHMSATYVQADEFVPRGKKIGAVGNTGLSTGPHLHFEVRKNGIPTNPLDYLISY